MSTIQIAILVGSLRRASRARMIAQEAARLLPEDFVAQLVEIGDLPLYDADYDDPAVPEKPLPPQYRRFRQEIKGSDGVLFVTAEHNRTIPACLKNAVDVGSKPNGDVAWRGLPAGIVSHSVGRLGGYSANKNLRLALSYFDMPITGQPEAFLGRSDSFLGEEGSITDKGTREFLAKYLRAFATLVRANRPQARQGS